MPSPITVAAILNCTATKFVDTHDTQLVIQHGRQNLCGGLFVVEIFQTIRLSGAY